MKSQGGLCLVGLTSNYPISTISPSWGDLRMETQAIRRKGRSELTAIGLISAAGVGIGLGMGECSTVVSYRTRRRVARAFFSRPEITRIGRRGCFRRAWCGLAQTKAAPPSHRSHPRAAPNPVPKQRYSIHRDAATVATQNTVDSRGGHGGHGELPSRESPPE